MTGAHTPSASAPATEAQLVEAHLPLVDYAVHETAVRLPSYVGRDDLRAAGMLGLAQAARAYDASSGVPFSAFARRRIRGAILDELRSRDWASRGVRRTARRLQSATEEFIAAHGRAPSNEEVATRTGMSVEAVEKSVADVHRGTVLNYDSMGTEHGGIADMLPDGGPTPDAVIEGRERNAYLIDAVVALPERLRHVVVGYFFDERPMAEIAGDLGVSESRISQMVSESLSLMKDGINASLAPTLVQAEANPRGRVARRKAAYYAKVATASSAQARLAATPAPLTDRLAAVS